MGTTVFQERKDVLYSSGSIKEVFHTHIHLYGADVGAFWDRDEMWKDMYTYMRYAINAYAHWQLLSCN